jgi:protein tyrosine/serine phosphatase
MRNTLRYVFVALAIVVGLTASSASAQTAPSQISNIKIRNFGQMDAHYFRGAQPKENEFQQLAALGIKTVIDLRDDAVKYERPTVEALGMKYINIPMDDAVYPSDATIARFLKEINDPANGAVYVHCKGGRHRTGVTGAAYRMTKDGWDLAKAYTEMENYNFDTSYGRKAMRTFVEDFSVKARQQQTATAASGATVP